MKKTKYKKPKGIVSLITIIAVLLAILASSLYYENSITANVVKETATNNQEFNLKIIHIDSVKDLSQLNEGWYQIRNGYVFYLDSFTSYIPIWIKVNNPNEQNGLLVVDADGTVKFDRTYTEMTESEIADEEENKFENEISGNAVGLEKVSGFEVVKLKPEAVIVGKSGQSSTSSTAQTGKPYFVDLGNNHYKMIFVETKEKSATLKIYEGSVSIDSSNRITSYDYNKDSQPTTHTISNSEALKDTILQEWKSLSLNNVPITGGSADLTKCGTQGQNCIYTNTIGTGVSTKTITTTLYVSTTSQGTVPITQVTTQTGTGTSQKTTEVITLSDKSTIKITYKDGTTEKDKVVFSSDGKNIEMAGTTYGVLGVNAYTILKIAAQEGFTKAEYKDGRLVDGSKSILQIETDGIARTLVFDGQIIKKEVSNGAEIIYTGYVTLDGKRVILGNGASSEIVTKDEKGKITYYKSELIGNDGLTSIETEYKDGTTTVKLYKRNDPTNIESWKEISTFNILGQVTEQKNQFYGMYEFTKGGENFYYDKTTLGSIIIKDVNGKDVTEQFKDDKLALGVGIDQIRERIEAKSTVLQQKWQSLFAMVERVFSEFRGLKYYETLFFDEGSLLAWHDSVDRIFATMFLGTEYWSSGLCSQYIDGEDSGIAYAETPQGLAQVGAHVEATRTQPISGLEGNEYIYKITFNIRNGDFKKDPRAPEEMNINIVLKGQKTARVFKNNIKIERGDTFGRAGSSAIVQDSNFLYGEVCITFDKVPFKWSIDGKELCNKIIEGSGESTPLSGRPSGSGAGSSGSGNDINDF